MCHGKWTIFHPLTQFCYLPRFFSHSYRFIHCRKSRQKQFRVKCFAQRHLSVRTRGAGIEPPTFGLVDDRPYLLSNSSLTMQNEYNAEILGYILGFLKCEDLLLFVVVCDIKIENVMTTHWVSFGLRGCHIINPLTIYRLQGNTKQITLK